MLKRSLKNYHTVLDFRKKFNKSTDVQSACALMHQAELAGSYLDRRVSLDCLQDSEKGIEYTATGKKDANGIITPYQNDKERLEYLKRVDKGIYTEELKHKMTSFIGFAMIVGGLLGIGTLIAFSVGSFGVVPVVLGLIAATLFASGEFIFVPYDNATLFEKLRNRRYQQAEWLKTLERNLSNSSL